MFERFKFKQKNDTYDMTKQKLTLSVDSNLIALARSKGINLSKLMEQILLSNNQNGLPFRGFDSGSNPDRSMLLKQPNDYTGAIHTYYKTLELEPFTDNHRKTVIRFLDKYVLFCGGDISLDKTIEYLTVLKSKYDVAYCSKQSFQILKLLRFLDCEWVDKLPRITIKRYEPSKVTDEQFDSVLKTFNNDLQMIAVLKLGRCSGLRAFELYGLTIDCIDIENRVIHVNRDTTKNDGSVRDVYFDLETQAILRQYMNFCKAKLRDNLFPMQTVAKKLKTTGIRLKETRHLFARNCTLKGVPSGIVMRWMGHKINNRDVLNAHYNFIGQSDLKQQYDKYFLDGD